MPELPEVETLKLGLQKYLIGLTIEDVEVRNKRIFSGDQKDIIGAKIVKVERFGKGLVIELDNSYSLAIHIKLTGQLVYRNPKAGIMNQEGRVEVPNKFTHVIFHLNPYGDLYYNDVRQFGWIKVIKTQDIGDLPFFKNLGPDILNNVTIEQFNNKLKK